MPVKNLMAGEAGRLRVASEMMIRGYHIFLPTVDDGIDLFTECGLRIQVKSSHSSHGRYYANFRHWSHREGKRKQITSSIRNDLTHVIVWGINEDVFWIIPRKRLDGYKTISVATSRKHPARRENFDRFKNDWKSLKER